MGKAPLRRMFVYTIRGPDGVYVGETINPKARWYAHRAWGRKGGKGGSPLHVSMLRHGVDAFTFEIVATCVTLCGPGGYSGDAMHVESLIMVQLLVDGERLLNASNSIEFRSARAFFDVSRW